MNDFSKKWNKILSSKTCHGYYTAKPCRAHTSNLKHEYCKRHKMLVKQREKDEKKN